MIRNSVTGHLILFGLLATASTLYSEGVNEKGPEPRHISFGKEVNLADYLVSGKIVIFDFYSDFCPPCRQLAPHLEALHRKRRDIAVVVVNINRRGVVGIDWTSPVALEFRLTAIPHLIIYGNDGQITAEGDAAFDKVVEWIKSS